MSIEKAIRIANTENSGVKGVKALKYNERAKGELYKKTKQAGIEGRSKMSKKELIEALRNN